MPLIETLGSSSARSFGWGSFSLGKADFIGVLKPSSGDFYASGIGVSSDGKTVYAAVKDAENQYIVRLDSGKLSWQNSFNLISGIEADVRRICVGSSGNIYMAGGTLIAKMSSTGSILWARTVASHTFYGCGIDSQENIYVPGTIGTDSRFLKFDSSGNFLVGRTGNRNGTDIWYGITRKPDSSGRFGICSQTHGPGNGSWEMGLTVFNSDLTTSFDRIYSASDWLYGNDAAVSPETGDFYACGRMRQAFPDERMYLLKFNSSGTLQWNLSYAASSNGSGFCDVDKYGNVYAVVAKSSGNTNVVKFNASGTLQWQREITGSAVSIFVDEEDSFSMTLRKGTNSAIVVRLPIDGSKTGTYNINGESVSYLASSEGVSSRTPNQTGGFNIGSFTPSTSSPTISTSPSSLTSGIQVF